MFQSCLTLSRFLQVYIQLCAPLPIRDATRMQLTTDGHQQRIAGMSHDAHYNRKHMAVPA